MGGKGGGGGGDPEKAAKIQGEEARKLNEQQTWANRPDQSNAWGSTSWGNTPEFDSATGQMINRWTQTETLNPELQKSLDAQLGMQSGRSELAGGMFGDLQKSMGTPMNFDKYGEPIGMDWNGDEQRQTAEDSAYGRATSRLDPQFEQQAQALEVKLRNQGLRAGDASYDAQMGQFNRGKNDAYEQARMGATQEGRTEMQQGYGMASDSNDRANALRNQQIQEDLFKRGHTLEEINSLMAGQKLEGSTPSSEDKATVASNLS